MDRMHKREQSLAKRKAREMRKIARVSKQVLRKYAHSSNIVADMANELAIEQVSNDSAEERNDSNKKPPKQNNENLEEHSIK